MKNRLFYIFFIAFLSSTATAQSELLLWADLASKHFIINAIEKIEKTNEALGISSNTTETKTEKFVASLPLSGIGVLTYFTRKVSNAGIRSITPSLSINEKMMNYTKEYQRIFTETVDLMEIKNTIVEDDALSKQTQETESSDDKTTKQEAEQPDKKTESSDQDKTTKQTEQPDKKLNSTNQQLEKKNISVKTKSSKTVNYYDNEIAKKQKELARLVRRKPGFLYRSSRIARGIGPAAIIAAEVAIYISLASDTLFISFDNLEQLQLVKEKLVKDCERTSELLVSNGADIFNLLNE